MSANRRYKRAQERFKEKIHKQFIERTKHMTEDQIKTYVDRMVNKYAYLNQVAVVEDGVGPKVEDLFDKPDEYGS